MSVSSPVRRTLMAVFAHPDDEAFGIGGTLARYGSDPHVRVILVCATRGEAGEISDPGLATPENLGAVREQELRCACQTLGVNALYFLDYRDSGMAGTSKNLDPNSLAMADFDDVVGRIVTLIRREHPDVVVTFDETGGYGHPDHIAIHHHTRAAYTAAADPTQYVEQMAAGLEPHQPQKLYYTAIPRRFFLAVVAKLREMNIEVPKRLRNFGTEPIGLPDEACTTDIPVSDFWEAKQSAIRCHATQLKPDSTFALLPAEVMRDLQAWECFQLAESSVREDEGSYDLFAGLP